MTWNYRVVDWEEEPYGGPFLAIHEVFYDDQGNVEYYTEDPITVTGDTLEELLHQLRMMEADCKSRPILKKSELPGGKDQSKA